MRLTCLLLMVLLLVPAPSGAQPAWVRAYQEGVQAFQKKNDALAEAKLKEAKERGPAQGRRVNFSGINFDVFIPDYYLGLIAARNGRHSEAITLLESAIAKGLITERERNDYAAATGAIARARDDTTPTPPPVWQAEFQRAMFNAEQALKNKRFADARTSANTARASAKDARSQSDLAALERRILSDESTDLAENVRQALAKGNETEAQGQLTRLTELNPQFPGLNQLRNDLADFRRRRDADQGRREADQIAARARTALSNGNASAAQQEIGRLAAAYSQHPALGQLRNDLSTLEASLAKQAGAQQFQKLMADGRSALRDKRYADARASASSALAAAGDASGRQQAEQLRRDIDDSRQQEIARILTLAQSALAARNTGAAQSQIAALAYLDPQNPSLVKLRADLARLGTPPPGADIARIEREGARQFFSGDYQGARSTLQQSVGAGRTSPRIFLYLACSNAALSLLAGPSQDAALLQQARQQYAQAQPQQNPFTADRRYISPRILELLAANR